MRAVVVGDPDAESHAGAHRHTSHEHEHEFEPQRGLPEPLPAGERVLWQGAPDWRVLARECFHVRKLVVYFSALVVWRVATTIDGGVADAAIAGAVAVFLAGTAIGLALLMAWMSARTSLYTITDRRVVMRVGIVLSVTFNLPFRKIESAGLHALPYGRGDIALALSPENRIAYPHLWPHVRPWRVARTQPSLRCIDDAGRVSGLLTEAWRAACHDVAAPPTVPSRDAIPIRSRTPAHVPSGSAIDAAQAA